MPSFAICFFPTLFADLSRLANHRSSGSSRYYKIPAACRYGIFLPSRSIPSMKPSLPLLSLFLFIATTGTVVRAQDTLDITRTVTQSIYHFSVISGTSAYSALLVADPAKGQFIAPFSTLGDTVVTVRLDAPPGKVVQVKTPPDIAATATLSHYVNFGTVGYTAGQINVPAQIEYIGASGDVPSTASHSGTLYLTGPGGNNGAIQSNVALTPGQTFLYRSVILTATVPASYNVDFNLPFTDMTSNGNADDVSEDPGPWVTLIDEPISGVTIAKRTHSTRAHFLVTNTGDFPSTFRLLRKTKITNHNPRTNHGSGRGPAVRLNYRLNGKNATGAFKRGLASSFLEPGGTARVAVKASLRRKTEIRRKVTIDLAAVGVESSASAVRRAVLKL